MINHVQFPGLGIDLTVDRIAFSIGSLNVYWYGICIAAGLALALVFAFARCRDFGIDDDRFIDVVMLATVFAIVGARAYYVIFAPFKYESLWDMINLRDGGIAIYGSVIGAAVSGYFLCKWRKIPVLPAFDITAIGFLIGQALGRWGNFFNQEAFGINSSGLLRMYSEGTHDYLSAVQQTLAASGVIVNPASPVHPTFLYESLWCLLGFVLLALYVRHRKFNGEIALLYVMWYGVERAFVEGLRTDALSTIFGLRISQVIAAVSVLAAGVLWLVLRKKYKNIPLMVNYTAIVKEKGGSTSTTISWPAKEKAPTRVELNKKIDTALASMRRSAAGIWPVGVWHAEGLVASARPQSNVKATQANTPGTLPVGVFHTK